MSCRKLIPILLFVITVGVIEELHAQEDEAKEGSEFIDMPKELEEKDRQAERERQLAKGDVKDNAGYLPGYRGHAGLGLSPHAPHLAIANPGGITPSFGAKTRYTGAKFDFHGYLQATLRVGLGKREDPSNNQSETTWHADPVVVGGAYGWFDHSNTVPTPWAQLNFSYGNEKVKANVLFGAWSTTEADEAAGSFMGHAQQLFTDVYLSYTPDAGPVGVEVKVGAFPDRYGFMAKWHTGAYGASLIADIYGLGVTSTVVLPFEGPFDIIMEGGLKGELNKVPLGTPQSGAYEYARTEEGSTFAGHAHLGINFAKYYTPTFHFIQSWSSDDRADPVDYEETEINESHGRKDGYLRILGGDLRIDGEHRGYFYLGGSYIKGKNANSLTDLVRILNTGSGKELNERYWGYASQGNGELILAGLQYTVSLGTWLRKPMDYWGEGPDLTLSFFGIFGRAKSIADDNLRDSGIDESNVVTLVEDIDQYRYRNMVKYGAEAVYSFSRYVGCAVRIDHVIPNFSRTGRSFAVFSPKIILRPDWVSRATLTLQYAGYLLGDDVIVQGDNRMTNVPSDKPDRHLVAVYGTVWW